MNIDELRNEIDRIDDGILALISKRYELVRKVGEIKQSKNGSVFVPEREQSILERLSKKAGTTLPKEAISPIFREIMSGARLVEHPITVAYIRDDLLSILAAYSKFGSCINLNGLDSLDDIFNEVQNNLNSYAVVAMEGDALSPPPGLKIISEIHLDHPSQVKFLILGK